MPDAHKNFAYSTVATAPSPATSGTSLVVASGDGAKFPAVSFNATVWPANAQPTTANAEIVRVTGRSTDTLTITRAQESTSARTIVVGDQIAATITAKSLTDIEGTSIDGWAANATSADWSNNSHKITSLLNGTAAQDAAPLLQSRRNGLHPTGSIAETFFRLPFVIANMSVLSSQRVSMMAIWLPSGVTVTSISLASATTAAGSPTHQVFGLYDSSLNLLRSTSDDTSTAWPSNTIKTLNLTSTFTTTYEGIHYLAILVTASTVPTIAGINAGTLGGIASATPLLAGTSDTGVNALQNPAAALSGVTTLPYAYIS